MEHQYQITERKKKGTALRLLMTKSTGKPWCILFKSANRGQKTLE